MSRDANVVVSSAVLHRLHAEREYLRSRLITTIVDYILAAHQMVVDPIAIGRCLDEELQGLEL